MQLLKQLSLAALLAPSLAPAAHAFASDFDDRDEIAQDFDGQDTDGRSGDDLVPTW